MPAVGILPGRSDGRPGFLAWIFHTVAMKSTPKRSFGGSVRFCLVPKYRSVVWTLACPSSNWICSSSPPPARQSFAHVRRKSWVSDPLRPVADRRPDLTRLQLIAMYSARLMHVSKDAAALDAGGLQPNVEHGF